jgi:hypothetical protein
MLPSWCCDCPCVHGSTPPMTRDSGRAGHAPSKLCGGRSSHSTRTTIPHPRIPARSHFPHSRILALSHSRKPALPGPRKNQASADPLIGPWVAQPRRGSGSWIGSPSRIGGTPGFRGMIHQAEISGKFDFEPISVDARAGAAASSSSSDRPRHSHLPRDGGAAHVRCSGIVGIIASPHQRHHQCAR